MTIEQKTNLKGLRRRRFLVSGVVVLLVSFALHAQSPQQPLALFTYDELVTLYEQDLLPEALQQKLTRLRTTPVVNNGAAARGIKPFKPRVSTLGRVLRVASWNIERGLNFTAVRAALLGADRFSSFVDSQKYPRGSKDRIEILHQASLLRQADVIVLNEVDWGVKRTEYRDIARDLAAVLGMNYAWGAEFVEVDPLVLGTETFTAVEDVSERAALVKEIVVDKARMRNLHGTAILSRYPLSNVRLIPFKYQGYDWFVAEKKKISKLEEAKRKGAAYVFNEAILREVRRGGRTMLLADIEDADLPAGRVTVVATHLEDKVKPEGRLKQLEEVLSQIKDISNPVVIAGDMNTNGSDATPISFQRAIKHRLGSGSFWVNRGIKYATGVGLLYDISLGALKTLRTWNDPTVKSVKFVSENPEENFFSTLKDFRFADGGAFDFRGLRQFSQGDHQETLSDSNERGSKGFVPTFELQGKIDLEFKLDWFFVKPIGLTDPDDRDQPFDFAPAFGRTLKELNESIKDRISDHNPITVDLPFAKPRPDVPSTQSTSLKGTSWQLVKFQGGDDSTMTPDDKTKYTVTFGANGRVTARVDCNRGMGNWKSSGNNEIEFGPLALTRAMCPKDSLHDHIVRRWNSIRSYTIKDGHLFLSLAADGGIFEFEPLK